MLALSWTYSNSHRLTKWYGHVDYYGKYVIGQWFALDAETGTEFWSRKFLDQQPFVTAPDVIVAYETRSDGPWTAGFGIYGIDAQTGQLLWTNHRHRLWQEFLRCFDFIPDSPTNFATSQSSLMISMSSLHPAAASTFAPVGLVRHPPYIGNTITKDQLQLKYSTTTSHLDWMATRSSFKVLVTILGFSARSSRSRPLAVRCKRSLSVCGWQLLLLPLS